MKKSKFTEEQIASCSRSAGPPSDWNDAPCGTKQHRNAFTACAPDSACAIRRPLPDAVHRAVDVKKLSSTQSAPDATLETAFHLHLTRRLYPLRFRVLPGRRVAV